jgi:hypothetical protein
MNLVWGIQMHTEFWWYLLLNVDYLEKLENDGMILIK